MKIIKFLLILFLIIGITGTSRSLYAWGFFKLFTDKTDKKTENNEPAADKNFNSGKDILYLPLLKGKKLFDSIDDLSICRREDVRKYIYIYLTSARRYTANAISRSYYYSDILHDVFKKNSDIPEDLSLLPLLESGFTPMAVSRSHAVGLWQFMRNTSKRLGLRHNKWIDERRDIEKSTLAAIKHLRNHYRTFGSWGLALTAYNGGGGYVKKRLRRSGTKNIWDLRNAKILNRETYEYLPKFIALVLIYKNQKLFGIEDEIKIPEIVKTKNFTLKHSVDTKVVSKITGVSLKMIKFHNPELTRRFTPPSYRGYALRLPESAVEKLEKKEKILYKKKIRRVIKYKIKRGDSISKIANKFKKKSRFIMKFNSIKNPRRIFPGQVIYIPIH